MNNGKCSASDAQVQEIKEIFLPVKGFEGRYEISNLGKLITIDGKVKGRRLMIPSICSQGYHVFKLRGHGNKKDERLHRLIAIHFLPNPDNLPFVNHKDGNKLNNKLSNLEWCTPLQNVRHAIETGLVNNKGENATSSILTNADVLEIRRLFKEDKMSHTAISKIYSINRRHIGDIINRVSWKHI